MFEREGSFMFSLGLEGPSRIAGGSMQDHRAGSWFMRSLGTAPA